MRKQLPISSRGTLKSSKTSAVSGRSDHHIGKSIAAQQCPVSPSSVSLFAVARSGFGVVAAPICVWSLPYGYRADNCENFTRLEGSESVVQHFGA